MSPNTIRNDKEIIISIDRSYATSVVCSSKLDSDPVSHRCVRAFVTNSTDLHMALQVRATRGATNQQCYAHASLNRDEIADLRDYLNEVLATGGGE